ncbi:hypothetical protein ETAA8_39650 [Anatilimnocola aggregata]|uniref:Uncharacterized protein n=2 Tax=Anatilimnocola aggregata TaxID=2528021 RepID=A0A517YF57_9BACT|nr:hypothetical protein ETAA8_39650 [Anatilimnocola aggregata]
MDCTQLTTKQLETLLEQLEPGRQYLMRLEQHVLKSGFPVDDPLRIKVLDLRERSCEVHKLIERLIAARRGHWLGSTWTPGKDDPPEAKQD